MGAKTQASQFNQILETFPASVREGLQTIKENGGILSVGHTQAVMNSLNIPVEDLMLRLLPIAKLYSRTPISGFQVGAVVKSKMSDNPNDIALFLGANIEFDMQPLTQTIHAEQSAVINAWLQGAKHIDSIAVTAAPCGYCRQFLNELEGSPSLKVILKDQSSGQTRQHNLPDLLPEAFGPRDLGSDSGLMGSSAQQADLKWVPSSNDSLVLKAAAAAEKSYAPYSGNLAGCAIETSEGGTYTGRYAENAAFNPSLTALHTALIGMTLGQPGMKESISRVVLVEKPTSINQRKICELLLQTVAPKVKLEYFEAV